MSAASRNYRSPREIRRTVADLDQWAQARETSVEVATAIHAISDSRRSAEDIWEGPTLAEFDHVEMAVAEYLAQGDFEPVTGGLYQWGAEAVQVGA